MLNDELKIYINFAYKDDVVTKRSHSNYVFMLWNDFINFSSKRQITVITSTTKTEYIDQYNATKKITFLIETFKKFDWKIDISIEFYADNQFVIKLIDNLINHVRIKHISVQYHYIREQMQKNYVKLIYFNIKKMIVDELIKLLI